MKMLAGVCGRGGGVITNRKPPAKKTDYLKEMGPPEGEQEDLGTRGYAYGHGQRGTTWKGGGSSTSEET